MFCHLLFLFRWSRDDQVLCVCVLVWWCAQESTGSPLCDFTSWPHLAAERSDIDYTSFVWSWCCSGWISFLSFTALCTETCTECCILHDICLFHIDAWHAHIILWNCILSFWVAIFVLILLVPEQLETALTKCLTLIWTSQSINRSINRPRHGTWIS